MSAAWPAPAKLVARIEMGARKGFERRLAFADSVDVDGMLAGPARHRAHNSGSFGLTRLRAVRFRYGLVETAPDRRCSTSWPCTRRQIAELSDGI